MALGPRPSLVGAVFPDRVSATAAADELSRRGYADDDITSALWSSDGFVVDSHAGSNLKRGLMRGAVIGAILGAVLGVVIAVLVWQALNTAVAVIVGVMGGGTLGGFWGAYAGFNRYRPQLWQQQDWSHLSLGEGDVLLVVSVEEGTNEAASILERHGGRRVEPVHPG